MFHNQGALRQGCSLLAVLCGRKPERKHSEEIFGDGPVYQFPELVSSGRLEVQTLVNPSSDEFRKTMESLQPNIVYLQGEQVQNDEVGSLVWGGVALSSDEAISSLFDTTLPTTVYLEIASGEKLAEALYSKGIPYVIYWKNTCSCYAASHFSNALFSVIQSSSSHTWDAFQLAHASFRLYFVRSSPKFSGKSGPHLLGTPPKITVTPPAADTGEGEESSVHSVKIYDDHVSVRFLVCGESSCLDTSLLGALEDGLNALLSIEVRGSKLHNRVSATPPPLQAGTFSRGVVTMRCDLSTCSAAHVSLLVSGSAQTCFDDKLLENHIKNEIIENSQLVYASPSYEENNTSLFEPRKSASIACGAAVFEVCMKVPTWASQVLRQLAPDIVYRSFVALGIAGIQGLAVASFEKVDADRLLFFSSKQQTDTCPDTSSLITSPPLWLRPPVHRKRRAEPCDDSKTDSKETGLNNAGPRQKLKISAPMRPIPHIRRHKMMPFSGISGANWVDSTASQVKANNMSVAPPTKHSNIGSNPNMHRKSLSSSFQAKQIISLNPLPLKKHGCGRSPIQICSEEEFLKDVMQFLILRGHTRLIPQGGLAEFPDAILNAKRLDLYNLYREVVSRGGFHVGNGINWKGQVFSKMRNHTMTNRMTGVGNTLKRHYETYLLEYELAHDDVDGECCLLCHSSAAGDWVNCGMCGEWAHFGCDRRQGLGAFKDYAKTDGLEYICPHCSMTNFKKKPHKSTNGFS